MKCKGNLTLLINYFGAISPKGQKMPDLFHRRCLKCILKKYFAEIFLWNKIIA